MATIFFNDTGAHLCPRYQKCLTVSYVRLKHQDDTLTSSDGISVELVKHVAKSIAARLITTANVDM